MANGSEVGSWWMVCVLTVANLTANFHRFLLTNLSAAESPECAEECAEAAYVVVCGSAEDACGSSSSCVACFDCRASVDSSTFNLLDGLCLSQSEYGLLAGYGFSVTFCLSGLVAGQCISAPHVNKPRLLALAILSWSLAVALMGAAGSFASLLFLRMAQGVGQGFCAPCSYKLISERFPATMWPAANGIYAIGVFFGAGLSSLSIYLSLQRGWRVACVIVGGAGVAVALLVWWALPNAVGASEGGGEEEGEEEDKPLRSRSARTMEFDNNDCVQPMHGGGPLQLLRGLRSLASNKIFVVTVMAACCRFFGGYTIQTYLAIYFGRRFPQYEAEYSILNAAGVCVAGAMSCFLGGRFATLWSPFFPGSLGYIPAAGAILALPCLLVALSASDFVLAILFLFLGYLFGECYLGPLVALIQNEVPAALQGTGVAVYMFCVTLVGNSAPDVLAGWDPSTDKIGRTLGLALCASYLGSALFFLWVAFLLGKRRRSAYGNSLDATACRMSRGGGEQQLSNVADDSEEAVLIPATRIRSRRLDNDDDDDDAPQYLFCAC